MKLTTTQIRQLIKEELSNVLETNQNVPSVGVDEDPEIQKEFMKELKLEGLADMVLNSIFENFLKEYENVLGYVRELPNPKDRMEELEQKLNYDHFEDILNFAYKAVKNSKTFSGWSTKDYKSMYGFHPSRSVTKHFAHEKDISVLTAEVKELIDKNIELKEEISLIKPFLLDLVGDKITYEGKTFSLDLVRKPEHLSQAFELWRGLTGR